MVYIGVSARILVNMDALNMAESVGNIVRHKKAPIVVREDNRGYTIKYVPVISGQSIAHGYQRLLAKIAGEKNLKVCPLCSQGIFVKHGTNEIIRRLAERYNASYARNLESLTNKMSGRGRGSRGTEDPIEIVEAFEKEVIENCVVEDVGGFLYTGTIPVKRTSRFMTGYMMPATQYITAVGMEAQMHVRHDPKSPRREEREEETGQAIYYVETASALYTVVMGLDVDLIGCYEKASGGWEELQDAKDRREAAVRALAMIVNNLLWGAKKSRFMPTTQIESLVVTISHPFPFNPTPGHEDRYIVETTKRASGFLNAVRGISSDAFVEIYYYVSNKSTAEKPGTLDGDGNKSISIKEVEIASDAVLAALKHLDKSKCR